MCPSDGKLGLSGESGVEGNFRKGNINKRKRSNLMSKVSHFSGGSYGHRFQDFLVKCRKLEEMEAEKVSAKFHWSFRVRGRLF